MAYFNYHAKAKKLIISGNLTSFKIVTSYHGISPALILFFNVFNPMPIREYRFNEYLELIKNYYYLTEEQTIIKTEFKIDKKNNE